MKDKSKEHTENTEKSESKEVLTEVESKKISDIEPIKELIIDAKQKYKYKVIQKFGSKAKGSEGEAKGSVVKVLLEKKLIEIVK